MAKHDLAHDKLLSLLHYNPETGIFTWKVNASTRARIGVRAGRESSGYRQIRIHGWLYLEHRLAWFYMNGQWPDGDIDHKDTDKLNNRISNLRPANDAQNAANKNLLKSNTTGFKGIQARPNGRWRASMEAAGQWISLGTYGSKEEAAEAYLTALESRHGEYARAA